MVFHFWIWGNFYWLMLIIGLKMIQPKIVSKTLQYCTWHILGVEKWNFPVRFRAFLEDWYQENRLIGICPHVLNGTRLLQPKILSFLCSHLDISLTTGAGAVPFTVFIFINNIDSCILINAIHCITSLLVWADISSLR